MALEPAPSNPPLVVVAHDDPATADSLRHAIESAGGWRVLVVEPAADPAAGLAADPAAAGLAAALAAGPSVALIGCAVLANLPANCSVPLVAVGDDDRPADVSAAMAAGARSLLAWPDGAADLPSELARVAATATAGRTFADGGLVIAIRGVQGGAGTTTIATHLAAAWSRWGPGPVLLLDLSGGLSFRLDLGAVTNWTSLLKALAAQAAAGHPATRSWAWADPYHLEPAVPLGPENPECGLWPVTPVPLDDVVGGDGRGRRDGGLGPDGYLEPGTGLDPDVDDWPYRDVEVDPATLAGSLAEPWAGLSVLPRSGPVDGFAEPPPSTRDVQNVLEAARDAYRVIVVDLPVDDLTVADFTLAQADVLIAVGRCETAGVRGLQAALGDWTRTGHDPDTAGAVVTGVRPRAPLAPREVRTALGDHLWALVPAAAAELAAAAEDGVLLLDRQDLPAVQAMVALANRVVPFTAVPA